jgi:hypothetical protein
MFLEITLSSITMEYNVIVLLFLELNGKYIIPNFVIMSNDKHIQV